jgi:hypothetical protein
MQSGKTYDAELYQREIDSVNFDRTIMWDTRLTNKQVIELRKLRIENIFRKIKREEFLEEEFIKNELEREKQDREVTMFSNTQLEAARINIDIEMSDFYKFLEENKDYLFDSNIADEYRSVQEIYGGNSVDTLIRRKTKIAEIKNMIAGRKMREQHLLDNRIKFIGEFLEENRKFFTSNGLRAIIKEIKEIKGETNRKTYLLLEDKVEEIRRIASIIKIQQDSKQNVIEFFKENKSYFDHINPWGVYSSDLDSKRLELHGLYRQTRKIEISYFTYEVAGIVLDSYVKDARKLMNDIDAEQNKINTYKETLKTYLSKRIEKLRNEAIKQEEKGYKNKAKVAEDKAIKLEAILREVNNHTIYDTTMSFLSQMIKETRIVASEHRSKGVVGFFARLFRPTTSAQKLNKVFDKHGVLKERQKKSVKK